MHISILVLPFPTNLLFSIDLLSIHSAFFGSLILYVIFKSSKYSLLLSKSLLTYSFNVFILMNSGISQGIKIWLLLSLFCSLFDAISLSALSDDFIIKLFFCVFSLFISFFKFSLFFYILSPIFILHSNTISFIFIIVI